MSFLNSSMNAACHNLRGYFMYLPMYRGRGRCVSQTGYERLPRAVRASFKCGTCVFQVLDAGRRHLLVHPDGNVTPLDDDFQSVMNTICLITNSRWICSRSCTDTQKDGCFRRKKILGAAILHPIFSHYHSTVTA